jgi:CRP-like cAMP-binding protein
MQILNRQQGYGKTQTISSSRTYNAIDIRTNPFDSMVVNKAKIFPKRSLLRSDLDTLWKIEDGIVRTITFDEDGTLVVLGLWGTGDTVGQPFSHVNPFQIECLTQVKVTQVCARNWQLSAEQLMYHLNRTEELAVIRSYRKIDRMLVKLLEWLYDRFGNTSPDLQAIDFKITHQDIADTIGSTRVSISRALKDLERQGIIPCTSIRLSR